jgi:sugar lactone lactonase YvrE
MLAPQHEFMGKKAPEGNVRRHIERCVTQKEERVSGKYLLCGLVCVALIGCGNGGEHAQEQPLAEPEAELASAEIRIEGVGFATPESVLFDGAADVYLVANINGSPLAIDDNGFISRVAPDGTLLELKWIDGESPDVELNAPKGMAIVGDTLYVADISVVRRFDRTSGESQGAIEIPGGTFVNDLAATRDGQVLVSDSGMVFTESGPEDTGSAAVHLLDAGGGLTMIASENLDKPNGVLDSHAHDGVVVAPFGGNVVYLLDEDGERFDVAELPGGGLDGLMETADGDLLVSSWEASTIYRVTPDGVVSTVADSLPAPADFGWDEGRGALLVPLFNSDAVVIVPAG